MNSTQTKLSVCRLCRGELIPFIDFGRMPIANAFLKPSEVQSEFFYPLVCARCDRCSLIQLVYQPAPDQLFHDSYPFFTGSSEYMKTHFALWADSCLSALKESGTDPFVLEIGSNDGTFLKNFANHSVRHLGVEPCRNLSVLSSNQGVNTLCSFFNHDTVKIIQHTHGRADLILAANVFCHIPDISSLFLNAKMLLKPYGVIQFEDPYWGEILQRGAFDQIYDEHVFLFSVHSVALAAERANLQLVDAKFVDTHGGSMRYHLRHPGIQSRTRRLDELALQETQSGINLISACHQFTKIVDDKCDQLNRAIDTLRTQKKKIAGYAATSKSTTLLNYCQIGPDRLDYICDTTPDKQQRLSPGMHIPIVPVSHFHSNPPDATLMLAWNHRNEILQKEAAFSEQGGQWIHYMPKVEISPS